MKKAIKLMAGIGAISMVMASAALADHTVKVGVIAPFSGPFAIWGKQFQEAVEVYVAQNGETAGGHTVEFIYKDSGGPNPSGTKSLAQELIIGEKVDYLGGLVFTPNALSVASLIDEAEVPTVIFNAATSSIVLQSEYFVRTSFSLWQVSVPMAEWAWEQGIKTVVISVTDYGPGNDAQVAFTTAFEALGGEVLDAIGMPLSTTDFAPFMQRIKDQSPDAVFAFLPAGPPTFAFVKSYNENGMKDAGITFLGTGETDETTLEALGDAAIGLTTAYHYSAAHVSDLNQAFTSKLDEMFPGSVANLASVGAYDGAHVLYQMIAAVGSDRTKAVDVVRGLEWESPRGPVSLDPDTRHITQNVYIRRVAKDANGNLINEEFQTIEAVPDLGLL
ncbi:ABC transporter, substrate-binding protein (cluster 4, leucine/isoleucine/valine/benzoate) [hydrothermal vent metagenome]|uniref:ABC transporter, substrate-binding protein (Cluster 4, leucine/isoleucine/valine/benzoate) n=1 Tax=hydrothermal vent metagenome TaxID=652676 RepID=A0A3B0UIF0_9ZZZZ